jgi:hypothetical protein
MFVLQATPQTVESARTIIVIFATISVIFWRALLRIVVMVAAMVVIILLTSGALLLYQSLHHLAR